MGCQKKFCSIRCGVLFHSDQRILQGTAEYRSIKRYLLEQRGHRCESCQLVEWMGQPIPLDFDHINGNSEDNDLTNVKLLCPNCHALTSTYKGANRGHGRHHRRMKYAQGKSY
jgi:5-methylcytosine-specific restriction endonuclease McrA